MQSAVIVRGSGRWPRGRTRGRRPAELPGTDPEFVREQLLDRYDLSGAVMNDIVGFMCPGRRPYPDELGVALSRAFNDYRAEAWFGVGLALVSARSAVPYEVRGCEAEIRRCREDPVNSASAGCRC